MGWKRGDVGDLSGRQAVVTGANAGLGLEIATQLARAGASVTLACRNPTKAADAVEHITTLVPDAEVVAAPLDLADLSTIAAFARTYSRSHDRLDLLVNNAGLMAIDESKTADGFETQFGVNHLGHYALTQQLLPLLNTTPGARIGTMSSLVHRLGRMHFDDLMSERNYQRWPAYFQSKLANLLFTLALQKRLTSTGSAVVAVTAHPGSSHTDLGSEGHGFTNQVLGVVYPAVSQPVRFGALPMLRALTAPDVKPGEFYGPRLMVSGPAVRETPSRRARNPASAETLWHRSAALTGVDAFA